MILISEIFVFIGQFILGLINALGYAGVFVLMALESMIAPVPSELVMPFAGFLVAEGKMSLGLAWIASVLGSLVGSLISYEIGMRFGSGFVKRFGKFLLLNERHLQETEKWFEKEGDKTILIARFVPVVRHLISIPAGIAKMDLKKFLLYTLIGAGIWNFLLLYAGVLLGENWITIRQFMEPISIGIAAVIGLLVVGFWWVQRKNGKKAVLKSSEPF